MKMAALNLLHILARTHEVLGAMGILYNKEVLQAIIRYE